MDSTGPGGTEDSSELVRRVRAGDRKAADEVVRRYSGPLMRMIRSRVWDRMEAEDVHQDTMLIVLERLRTSGLDDPSKLLYYMRGTAINLIIGRLRRDQRRKTTADSALLDLIHDTSESPLDRLLEEEGASLVRVLLEEMIPRDREILRQLLEGGSKDESCARLDIDPQTYDRVKHRALHRLKALANQRVQSRQRAD